MGFRFSFTPLPGFFSPFLHSTSSLSVTNSYLGLEGGPPCFPQGFSCLVVLWILLAPYKISSTGLLPSSAVAFLPLFHYLSGHFLQSTTPINRSLSVWPLPLSLATTYGISFDFSSWGYLDVSVHPVSLHYAMYSHNDTWAFPPRGFPHSDIYGSLRICRSP